MNWIRVIFAICLLLQAACSTYDARWREARRATAAGKPFEGAYEGRWTSARYPGAGGKLWCIVTKRSQREYLAEFRATWHGVFASEHSVALKTTGEGRMKVPGIYQPERRKGNERIAENVIDELLFGPLTSGKGRMVRTLNFRGDAEIHMWIGSGRYRCEGSFWPAVDKIVARIAGVPIRFKHPATMQACYDAAYDAGTFSLDRH